MFKNLKMFITGFLACALLMGTIAGAFAAANDLNIQAVLSNSIKLKLNGKDWTPKDPATGNYYKPISYNGRAYLPVRAVVEEAAGMPVDYDSASQTIWIGGKTDSLNVSSSEYYEDYYGTIITTDSERLFTPDEAYKWGITNDKDLNMQYFTFYLKPNGNYKRFRASFFLDNSAKDKLTMNIRKDTPDGQVIKTLVLQPGNTIKDVDLDIGGVNKLCIESNIAINHGIIKKIVVGEPVFYNGNLQGASATHG